MRSRVWPALLASTGIAAIVYAAGGWAERELAVMTRAEAAEQKTEKSGGPPPLVIDRSAPLLLDDPPEEDPWAVPKGPVADNTACFCCHTNYEEEPLAARHAKANVGCIKCHGKSYAHRDDEDNITPPDVMFAAEKIEPNCRHCHTTHDAPAVEVIARWKKCCPKKTDPKKLVCTDCHGQHRLKLRTVRWDKRTGKLIVSDDKTPKQQAPGTAAGSPKQKPGN